MNFNNYKNHDFHSGNNKTAKNINSTKIDFDEYKIIQKDEKINFSQSTNNYSKNLFSQTRMQYNNNDNYKSDDYNTGHNYRNVNHNDYITKGRDFIKNVSDGNLESTTVNNTRKSSDIYCGRNNKIMENINNNDHYIEKNQLNTEEKYGGKITNNDYKNNSNPNNYSNNYSNNYEKYNKEREGDLKIMHRDFGRFDNNENDERSRPLSVNKNPSKFLDKFDNGFNDNKGPLRLESESLKTNLKYSNKNNDIYNADDKVKINQNDNIDNISKYPFNNNTVKNNKIKNFTPAEEQILLKNYSAKSNSDNKSLITHSLPETNLNYNSNTFSKYTNNNCGKINEYSNATNANNYHNNKYSSYKYTSTDDNIRNNNQGDLPINRNMDDIINIDKYSSNVENYSENNNNKNSNMDAYNNLGNINSTKAKYFSEKRMFRDKKEDQKNLISKFVCFSSQII